MYETKDGIIEDYPEKVAICDALPLEAAHPARCFGFDHTYVNAPVDQISAKSDTTQLSLTTLSNLTTSNFSDVRDLGCDRKWTFTVLQLPGTDNNNAPAYQISTQSRNGRLSH